MATAVMNQPLAADIEKVLIGGDLAQLKPEQRLSYYNHLCESLGLNPLTKPFQYLTLSGKTVLYATKDATEQLRKINCVSVRIVAREETAGCYVVTAQALMGSGRCDESIGAVNIENLKGEARSNAMMKAETKAKRRVTLSICGLGMLDESETDSIPGARPAFTDSPQEVAERRIKELSAPPSDPSYEERHKALILGVAEVLEQPPTTTTRRKGNIAKKALGDFQAMKKMLKDASDGTDSLYYEALRAAGVEHCDELDTAPGREVYKSMLTIHNRLKQDKALKLELETHALRIGASQFSRIMGENGFTDIDEFMANANGAQTEGLLKDLRDAQ